MGPSWRRHYGWQRGFRGNNSLLSQRINQLGEQIPKLYGPDYRHDDPGRERLYEQMLGRDALCLTPGAAADAGGNS